MRRLNQPRARQNNDGNKAWLEVIEWSERERGERKREIGGEMERGGGRWTEKQR